jgi:hypothetical protein
MPQHKTNYTTAFEAMSHSKMKQHSTCVLIAICSSLALFAGCGGNEPPPDPKAGKMVYVDTKSKQAFVGQIIDTPATNPQTGQPTLMPALYCSKCSQWHAVPPLDEINQVGNATRCTKTRVPLTGDGPWPDAEVKLGTVSGE